MPMTDYVRDDNYDPDDPENYMDVEEMVDKVNGDSPEYDEDDEASIPEPEAEDDAI
jgi:hypothetical protein